MRAWLLALGLSGVQIPVKANMSEKVSTLPPRGQSSGIRLKGKEAMIPVPLAGRVFMKVWRLEGVVAE